MNKVVLYLYRSRGVCCFQTLRTVFHIFDLYCSKRLRCFKLSCSRVCVCERERDECVCVCVCVYVCHQGLCVCVCDVCVCVYVCMFQNMTCYISFNVNKLLDDALFLLQTWLINFEPHFVIHYNQWSSNLRLCFGQDLLCIWLSIHIDIVSFWFFFKLSQV